jgi:hypothetical protein
MVFDVNGRNIREGKRLFVLSALADDALAHRKGPIGRAAIGGSLEDWSAVLNKLCRAVGLLRVILVAKGGIDL